MTPQQHADHLLSVYQSRRHLKPTYRLIDCPPLVPDMNADEFERVIEELRAVRASDPQWKDAARHE